VPQFHTCSEWSQMVLEVWFAASCRETEIQSDVKGDRWHKLKHRGGSTFVIHILGFSQVSFVSFFLLEKKIWRVMYVRIIDTEEAMYFCRSKYFVQSNFIPSSNCKELTIYTKIKWRRPLHLKQHCSVASVFLVVETWDFEHLQFLQD
jgi:hypothetical protein